MSSLKIFEFSKYCDDNNIGSFMILSTEQLGNRYSMMTLELRQLNLFVSSSDGLIMLKNEVSEVRFHDVKKIIINHTNPYYGVAFDVVCGGESNNIHRIVGKFNCNRGEEI